MRDRRCEAGDVRLPCKVARCWNHQIFSRATGPCLTAVWTLKRGDNLISTHVNTAAGAKRKLWAYCASVKSSCILWPQEWKIFKWLWCPGSCWTALMVWKHLSPWCSSALCLYPFIPSMQIAENCLWVSMHSFACCGSVRKASCTQPAIVPRTLAKANTSAGLILEQPWAWGRWQQLLSANLPVDIVAVLADRQPGLVGWQIPSVSRLSFPIKPFHLSVQSTPWQAKKWPE